MFDVEQFWGELLSGEADRVQAAYAALPPDEQEAIIVHLREMANGDGWADVQRESALAALAILKQ